MVATKRETPYVLMLKVVFGAQDELHARIIAEHLSDEVEKELELETGDSVDITQLLAFPAGVDLAPEEMLNVFRLARNGLFKTRIGEAFDVATMLDKYIHVLEHPTDDPALAISNYDYGRPIRIAKAVYEGKNPLE